MALRDTLRGGRRRAREAARPAADDRAYQVPEDFEASVVRVDDAVLTPFRRGPLRSARVPRSWMSGAVHDSSGRLVPESQREWDGDPICPVAADPRTVAPPRRARVLEGTWLYAGHWHPHFGHFYLETLTTLWPDRLPVAGIVGHRTYWGPAPADGRGPALTKAYVKPWQAEFLALSGWGGLPGRVVRSRPVRVERLLVPRRTVLLKSWVAPEAVALWRRVAAGVEPAGVDKVFLSRTAFHRGHAGNEHRVRVEAQWDAHLDATFAAAGYHVVAPEELPLREQLALVRSARVLAGASGSALHLAAFAEPGTLVLEVGDARSPDTPLPTQRSVDAACGHRSDFVAYRDRRGLEAALRRAERPAP